MNIDLLFTALLFLPLSPGLSDLPQGLSTPAAPRPWTLSGTHDLQSPLGYFPELDLFGDRKRPAGQKGTEGLEARSHRAGHRVGFLLVLAGVEALIFPR